MINLLPLAKTEVDTLVSVEINMSSLTISPFILLPDFIKLPDSIMVFSKFDFTTEPFTVLPSTKLNFVNIVSFVFVMVVSCVNTPFNILPDFIELPD